MFFISLPIMHAAHACHMALSVCLPLCLVLVVLPSGRKGEVDLLCTEPPRTSRRKRDGGASSSMSDQGGGGGRGCCLGAWSSSYSRCCAYLPPCLPAFFSLVPAASTWPASCCGRFDSVWVGGAQVRARVRASVVPSPVLLRPQSLPQLCLVVSCLVVGPCCDDGGRRERVGGGRCYLSYILVRCRVFYPLVAASLKKNSSQRVGIVFFLLFVSAQHKRSRSSLYSYSIFVV